MSLESFITLVFAGLTVGSVYALIALGLVTTYNVTGVINFAQGQYAMVSAFVMITLMQHKVSFFWSLVIAILISVLIGAALERFAIRSAASRARAGITLTMITLGADIVIKGIALILWGAEPKALAPFSPGGPLMVLGIPVQLQNIWILGITLLLVILVFLFLSRSILGKALRGSEMDKIAARLMGIRPNQMSLLAFCLSAAITGLAGITMAPVTLATYDMGLMLAVKGFVAAVLGGLTNPVAAIAGGYLLGLIESLGTGLFPSGYKDAITFGVLLLVLFLRPNGILGSLSGKRV